MGEYMKCINPETRWIWQHPRIKSCRFEYKALAGPTMTRELGARYLNACITRAWGVDIPGIGPTDEWSIEAGPAVEWAAVLPAAVANAIFLSIAAVSQLTEDDERDSGSPSGHQPSQNSTTATDAGAPAGSAHDGRTPQKPAGSGSAPKRKAGSR
jgi:hypothetical protein